MVICSSIGSLRMSRCCWARARHMSYNTTYIHKAKITRWSGLWWMACGSTMTSIMYEYMISHMLGPIQQLHSFNGLYYMYDSESLLCIYHNRKYGMLSTLYSVIVNFSKMWFFYVENLNFQNTFRPFTNQRKILM